jgi:hypothetical protein
MLKIIYRIKSHFISDVKILTKQDCVTIIRGKGYRVEREFSFSKGSLSYRTQIQVYDEKVWIKAYSGGYGESDTIHFPITKKQLLSFIRSNAA